MKHILIVDDSKTIRTVIKLAVEMFYTSKLGMKKTDFKLIDAVDGIDALKKLNEFEKIDLILTDYFMPNMNGIDFIQKVRVLDKGKTLPIIMITTEDSLIKRDDVIFAGATDLLIKPFHSDELYKTIHSYL